MPYRDSPDALYARIARLEEELGETRDDLARTRERYTRAMAALRIIAHSKKLTEALEGSKLSAAELSRLTEVSPSELPPESRDAHAKSDAKTAAKKKRARKSSKKKPVAPKSSVKDESQRLIFQGTATKKPPKRSGKPEGDGVYVMIDREDGVER